MSETYELASLPNNQDTSLSPKEVVENHLDLIKDAKRSFLDTISQHPDTSGEDIQKIESWLYKTSLSLESFQSLEKIFLVNPDISLKEIQETVKWHMLLSKMWVEVIELEYMYTTSSHRLGLQQLSSNIEIAMKNPFRQEWTREELLETLDGYHAFYELYRKYYAERDNFSQEFISYMEWGESIDDNEWWLYRALNGEWSMDMNVVDEFSELLEQELSQKSSDTITVPLEKYTSKEAIISLFIHPDFPGNIDDGNIRNTLGQDIDMQGKYISQQSYQDIIDASISIIKQDPAWKELIVSTMEKSLIPSSKKTASFLYHFYKAWIIDNNQSLSILEWKRGFRRRTMKFNEFVDMFGLPSKLIEGMQGVIQQDFSIQQVQNFQKMVKYFMRIESEGWYNVSNYAGASSAEWYLQTLKKDAKYRVAATGKFAWWKPGVKIPTDKLGKNWKTSSFDTRLRKVPKSVREMFQWLSQQYKLIGNPAAQDPKILSVTEQIILNMGYIYTRNQKRFLGALGGNIDDVEYLYSKIHHTKTDKNTRNLMKIAKKEIY